jgi:hypothetical protein
VNPKQKFWKWFEANEAALFEIVRLAMEAARQDCVAPLNEMPIFLELKDQLYKVHPTLTIWMDLGWEVIGDDLIATFTISALGQLKLIHCVKELVALAPDLSRWRFIAFRQPEDSEGAFLCSMGKIAISDVKVKLGKPRNGRFDIHFYLPHFDEASTPWFIGISWDILCRCVGEFNTMTKVNLPCVHPLEEAPADAKPVTSLRDWFGGTVLEEVAA